MKKSVTISNTLTALRFLLSFLLFYLIIKNKIKLYVLVVILGIFTDILDGYLARKLKQETKIGRWFDLIADGTFMGVGLVALTYKGYTELLILVLIFIAASIQGLSHLIQRKIIYTSRSKYLGKAVGWFYFAILITAPTYPKAYNIIKWPAVIYAYIIEVPRLYKAIKQKHRKL